LASGAKNTGLFYDINNRLISLMIKEGKTKEALEFLLGLIKKKPPTADWDQLTAATTLGECYGLLGKDDLAEKYYQQAVTIAERKLPKQDGLTAYKKMADFYFSRKRYGPAGIYLHKVLVIPQGIGEAETIRSTYLELFKNGSATGNYFFGDQKPSAISVIDRFHLYGCQTRQIAELQLYNTKKIRK